MQPPLAAHLIRNKECEGLREANLLTWTHIVYGCVAIWSHRVLPTDRAFGEREPAAVVLEARGVPIGYCTNAGDGGHGQDVQETLQSFFFFEKKMGSTQHGVPRDTAVLF